MLLILGEVIMLYVKNYCMKKIESYIGYSFMIAFGFPMVLICLVSSDILYEKYVAKLQSSHYAIYKKFLGLLVTLTISSIAFFVLLSLYMSKPLDFEMWGIVAMAPYYLSWTIIFGMFIFVSPGLIDEQNNIPRYQVLMGAIYLIFAFVYPIYLTIVISTQKEREMAIKLPRLHLIFQRIFAQ